MMVAEGAESLPAQLQMFCFSTLCTDSRYIRALRRED